MRNLLFLIIVGLIFTSCSKRHEIITIVDIGHNDRIELGRQLRAIKQYSPKIIALDFYLVPDSLAKDSILVKELNMMDNTVQIVGLHDLHEPDYIWDSLEVSNRKFKITNQGFANLTTEDSVLIKELPMRQSFNSELFYSFSYIIAENSFGVKPEFKNTGEKDLKLKMAGLGKNYKLITSKDLLSGSVKTADIFDKIIIMGYIGEKEDYFYLDKERTKKINGTEIHAAIVDEILDL